MKTNHRNDLNAIAVFSKVAELQNFRAAAQVLGVPRSTVSLKVAQLEDRLGARLIERTTRRLRLTEAGEAYYHRVSMALEALDEAERAVDELQSRPAGRLRLTTTVEGGQVMLGPVLAEYLRRYPEVEIEVVLADRQVDLLGEGFDLAIRAGATLPDSTLVARRLNPSGAFRIYASEDYLRRRGTPCRPEDLAGHDCLAMSSQSAPTHWRFRDGERSMTVEIHPRLTVNSFVVLRDLVTAGRGLARLPDLIATHPALPAGLRPVLEDFALPPVPYYAVYPSARNLSPKVRAFVELLMEWVPATP